MKAAVLGTGFIGPVHVEGLRRAGVEVRGILGSSPVKSAQAAKALNLDRGYTSYEELLSDPEVGAVHLASPNKFHSKQVLQALDAGKHVVCEKPLAMTSKETLALVKAAKKHPRQVTAVNYNIRFYPLNLEMKEHFKRGDFGKTFHVRGAYVQDWLLYPTDFNWRVLASEGGETRAVGDIGTHWLDLVTFITGLELEGVLSDLMTVHPKRIRPVGGAETFRQQATDSRQRAGTSEKVTTEDYGSVLLRFKGGAKGVMTVSQVTAGRKNQLSYEVAGSKSSCAWDSERPNEVWLGNRHGPNGQLLRDPSLLSDTAKTYSNYPGGHNEGFPDTFKQLYKAVYADIEVGRPSKNPLYATFEDGHRELLFCEAVLKSHKKKGWVKV